MTKKIAVFTLLLTFVLSISIPRPTMAAEVLRVYNWQDYINEGKDDDGAKIDDSVIELWEKDFYERTGRKVKVQYDTFETNETMLNTLKTGKTSYDLACPSDYVIQKMINATKDNTDEKISLEKYDLSKMKNYQKYVSPYISELFKKNSWEEYAVGYIWGTVGFIYNPETVSRKDAATWNLLWNPKYKNRVTCKDVSRDAYVVGALHVSEKKLKNQVSLYNDGKISSDKLQKYVNSVANDTSDEMIKNVEVSLSEMKKNIYGFEVDNGKVDIVSGKIDANLAWSGDAVYAINLAQEEDDKYLEYALPKEGSTVWFDGWIMPKGANKELAQDFVDFLCKPQIAASNMDYIGYTSVIAGNEIYDMVTDYYNEDDGKYEYDLTYFFKSTLSKDRYQDDGRVIIRTNDIHRQLAAQYPSEEESARCGIMEDFGDRNDLVLEMWSSVKSNSISWVSYVFMICFFIILLVLVILTSIKKIRRFKNRHYKIR